MPFCKSYMAVFFFPLSFISEELKKMRNRPVVLSLLLAVGLLTGNKLVPAILAINLMKRTHMVFDDMKTTKQGTNIRSANSNKA